MYSVKIDCGLIKFILICTGILYGSQLFIIWTNQTILNMSLTPLLYCFPLLVIALFMLLWFTRRASSGECMGNAYPFKNKNESKRFNIIQCSINSLL